MKTTDYGLPGRYNEFGVEKPPKDVDFAHTPGAAMVGTRAPVSDATLREMVREFHRLHGYLPTRMKVTEAAGHYRSLGFILDNLGFVSIAFEYGAPEESLE